MIVRERLTLVEVEGGTEDEVDTEVAEEDLLVEVGVTTGVVEVATGEDEEGTRELEVDVDEVVTGVTVAGGVDDGLVWGTVSSSRVVGVALDEGAAGVDAATS